MLSSHFSLRHLVAQMTVSGVLSFALTGCQSAPRGGVFPQGNGGLVFPGPPDPPRFVWVGELYGEQRLMLVCFSQLPLEFVVLRVGNLQPTSHRLDNVVGLE